jgi:RNA polymerase sigma-70 factor, ECF subfamily
VPTDAERLKPVGPAAAAAPPLAERRADEAGLNALMDRYASGDDAAFRDLYAELEPRVRRFLLRLSGRPTVADELVQEAFLRMHRARAAFNRGAPALPWAYTVARNVFLDHDRRRRVHAVVVLDDDLASAEPTAVTLRPDRIADSRETIGRVRAALARMPVAQREAFVLLRFEGLSVSDAAEVLGTTEASVKSRAFRAYEALRLAAHETNAHGRE